MRLDTNKLEGSLFQFESSEWEVLKSRLYFTKEGYDVYAIDPIHRVHASDTYQGFLPEFKLWVMWDKDGKPIVPEIIEEHWARGPFLEGCNVLMKKESSGYSLHINHAEYEALRDIFAQLGKFDDCLSSEQLDIWLELNKQFGV